MNPASPNAPGIPEAAVESAFASDPYIIALVQLILIAFVTYVAIRDYRARRDEKNGGFTAEVVRGEPSMNALYTAYGAAIASILVLIDNATHVEGHKVGLIILDFACVTYLYLSSWFRNSIFFPLMQQARKD